MKQSFRGKRGRNCATVKRESNKVKPICPSMKICPPMKIMENDENLSPKKMMDKHDGKMMENDGNVKRELNKVKSICHSMEIFPQIKMQKKMIEK